MTDGLDSPVRYNARIYKRAAYTREGALRHTYVRPDIDRQLATVTVYNSVRLVAAPVVQPLPVVFRPLFRAENTRGRSESCNSTSPLNLRRFVDHICARETVVSRLHLPDNNKEKDLI